MLRRLPDQIMYSQNEQSQGDRSALNKNSEEFGRDLPSISDGLIQSTLQKPSQFEREHRVESDSWAHKILFEETKFARDSTKTSEEIIWEWKSISDPYSSEPEQWLPYKRGDNTHLEKAYQNKEKEVVLDEWIVHIYDGHIFQNRKDNNSQQIQVRRILKNSKEGTGQIKERYPRLERFIGGETPKTYTTAFGSLDDYLSFFENRTHEMSLFAELFKKAESSQDLDRLTQNIARDIANCIRKEAAKNNKDDDEKLLAKLFERAFASFEEFYGAILRAYTRETFLYKQLNQYLRNEDWTQLDDLLPYAFCLCKAFQHPPLTSFCNQHLQQSAASQGEGAQCNLVLYRGAVFDEVTLNCYRPEKASTFSWNAVTSTSTNPRVAEFFSEINKQDQDKVAVIFVVEVSMSVDDLNKSNLIDIKSLSDSPGEEEIVLAPGSIFEVINFARNDKKAQVNLKLISDHSMLALQGKIMPGAMHAQVSKGKVAKIICQEGKELAEALHHLKGNRIVEEIELTLCQFDQSTLKILSEIFSTLTNLAKIALYSVSSKQSKYLAEIIRNVRKQGITNIEITDRSLEDKQQLLLFAEEVKHLNLLANLTLDFKAFGDIGDESLKILGIEGIRYLTSLKTLTLNFSDCQEITDEGVKNLCSEGLRYLTSLSNLTLHFKGCYQITDEGVKNIGSEGLRYMTSHTTLILDFNGCDQITNEGVKSLCVEGLRYLTSLTTLDVSFGMCPQITDEGLKNLCLEGLRHCTSLTALHLDFGYCTKISDEGVKTLSLEVLRHMTSLKTLSLEFRVCAKITNNGVKTLCSEGLIYLTSLTTLFLGIGQCPRISDEAVKSLCSEGLKNMTSLTSLTLDFHRCDRIKDSGLKGIFLEALSSLTSLTTLTLNFTFCRSISDEGVKNLCSGGLRYLTSLKILTLDFGWCSQITDEGVKSLCSEGLVYLASLASLTLRLEQCEEITENGVSYLRAQANILKLSLVVHQGTSRYGVNFNLKRNLHQPVIIAEPITQSSTNLVLNEKQQLYNLADAGYFLIEEKASPETIKKHYLEGLGNMISGTKLTLDFECFHGTVDKLLKDLFSEGLRYLTSIRTLDLNFRKSNAITNEGLKNLASEGLKYLTSLTAFSINCGERFNITDEGVKSLCSEGLRYLTSLTILTLDFNRCGQITDDGMIEVCSEGLRHLTSLKSLTLNFAFDEKITDKGIKSLFSEGLRFLTSLTNLSLDFSGLKGVTDEAMNSLCLEGLKNIPLLVSLNFNFGFCDSITDTGIKCLCLEGLRHLNSLTALGLVFSGCHQITEEGMNILYSEGLGYRTSLTTLSLDLSACQHITDALIQSLCSEGFKNLTSLTNLTLNFGSCTNITDEGARNLCFEGLRYMASLISLNIDLSGCHQISDNGVRDLRKILNYFRFN